jgi:hypothetical protein
MLRVSRFVITMPAVSYARELWRYGEPDLARQAARMSPSQCADVGERAGQLHISGVAAELWPGGPTGARSAILLAAVENLEGKARPCARSRRLPPHRCPRPDHSPPFPGRSLPEGYAVRAATEADWRAALTVNEDAFPEWCSESGTPSRSAVPGRAASWHRAVAPATRDRSGRRRGGDGVATPARRPRLRRTSDHSVRPGRPRTGTDPARGRLRRCQEARATHPGSAGTPSYLVSRCRATDAPLKS